MADGNSGAKVGNVADLASQHPGCTLELKVSLMSGEVLHVVHVSPDAKVAELKAMVSLPGGARLQGLVLEDGRMLLDSEILKGLGLLDGAGVMAVLDETLPQELCGIWQESGKEDSEDDSHGFWESVGHSQTFKLLSCGIALLEASRFFKECGMPSAYGPADDLSKAHGVGTCCVQDGKLVIKCIAHVVRSENGKERSRETKGKVLAVEVDRFQTELKRVGVLSEEEEDNLRRSINDGELVEAGDVNDERHLWAGPPSPGMSPALLL